MATREQIEAQIEAAPTDDGAYLILGDLLQLEGDPRGELIALDAAYLRGSDRGSWAERRAEILDAHLELQPRTGTSITYLWHLGFVRRITLGSSINYKAIFGHPSLRFVTELVFLQPSGGEFFELFTEALRQTPLLRSLALGDPERGGHGYHSPRVVDLRAVAAPVARLEQLFASEPVEIGDAPCLAWLRLENDPDAFRRLQHAHLPALATLSVSGVAPLDQMMWLIDTPPPSLVELELIIADGNDVIGALVDSPLLRQLRRLRLWNAGITPQTASLITPTTFGHLDLLDLSDPLLDDATIALVAGAAREVRTISPWVREILRRG